MLLQERGRGEVVFGPPLREMLNTSFLVGDENHQIHWLGQMRRPRTGNENIEQWETCPCSRRRNFEELSTFHAGKNKLRHSGRLVER